MFETGDRVKIRENYWEICERIYEKGKPLDTAREAMSKFIGQTKYVVGKNYFRRQTYKLEDFNGISDGFAWAEDFLEKVEG